MEGKEKQWRAMQMLQNVIIRIMIGPDSETNFKSKSKDKDKDKEEIKEDN
jgi:hypothetical protein